MPVRHSTKVPFPLAEDELHITLPPLPPNHFLSLQPIEPPSPPSVIAERYWSTRARPDTSSLAAADYDVSVLTGFLPPDEPVKRLNLDVWREWEDCLRRAQEEVEGLEDGGVGRISDSWREELRELKQPNTSILITLPFYRRAHVLLSFLGHFYIHSTVPNLSILPSNLSIPWIEVSDRLGIPPILTYADTVLWNWNLIDKEKGIMANNIEITTTFTSSPSEKSFFLLSLLCELHAPVLLRLMSATLDEAFFSDSLALSRIASYLSQISLVTNELTQIMLDAVKGSFGPEKAFSISPECFYWEIRPWFNGGKWIYKGVDLEAEGGKGDKEMEWGGPSAGQSSLVHALDLFLSVDHTPRSNTTSTSTISTSTNSIFPIPSSTISLSSSMNSSSSPSISSSQQTQQQQPLPLAPSAVLMKPKSTSSPLSNDSTFMVRASQYMPSHHRSFLQHLNQLHKISKVNLKPIPSVRELALRSTSSNSYSNSNLASTKEAEKELTKSYDEAVKSMKKFRDGHMRLVTVFIISVSKKEPAFESIFWNEWNEKRLEGIQSRRLKDELLDKEKAKEKEKEEDGEGEDGEGLVGTGGTELVGFLKLCRERTVEALVG